MSAPRAAYAITYGKTAPMYHGPINSSALMVSGPCTSSSSAAYAEATSVPAIKPQDVAAGAADGGVTPVMPTSVVRVGTSKDVPLREKRLSSLQMRLAPIDRKQCSRGSET